jgi:hypothetical protein
VLSRSKLCDRGCEVSSSSCWTMIAVCSLPSLRAQDLSPRASMKFSYNKGAYIPYGGNYQRVSVAWQYS